VWFRRGRLFMVSPVHGDYRRCQAETPLSDLFKFAEPARSIGKDTLQKSLDCLRLVGMCAAYGQASGVPDPINLIEDLGVRGSLIITRPVLSHYMSNRSEIDAGAKSLFEAVAQGVVASNVVKTFPLREAAAAHKFIGGRKTTGSIVMLPFE
jgi:NADPH2:quinone reductase